MELRGTQIVGGCEYGQLTTKGGKEVFMPVSSREERLQMSQVVREILTYPKQLVVSVASSSENEKFSFGIVKVIPVTILAYKYVDLFITGYIFSSRAEAVGALEKTLRLITSKFYDECVNDLRYEGDGFVMFNNTIVDWIMQQIEREGMVYVSEYF